MHSKANLVPMRPKAVALCNFNAVQAEHELAIGKGEELVVVQSLDYGWVLCQNAAGSVGKVPALLIGNDHSGTDSVTRTAPSLTMSQSQLHHPKTSTDSGSQAAASSHDQQQRDPEVTLIDLLDNGSPVKAVTSLVTFDTESWLDLEGEIGTQQANVCKDSYGRPPTPSARPMAAGIGWTEDPGGSTPSHGNQSNDSSAADKGKTDEMRDRTSPLDSTQTADHTLLRRQDCLLSVNIPSLRRLGPALSTDDQSGVASKDIRKQSPSSMRNADTHPLGAGEADHSDLLPDNLSSLEVLPPNSHPGDDQPRHALAPSSPHETAPKFMCEPRMSICQQKECLSTLEEACNDADSAPINGPIDKVVIDEATNFNRRETSQATLSPQKNPYRRDLVGGNAVSDPVSRNVLVPEESFAPLICDDSQERDVCAQCRQSVAGECFCPICEVSLCNGCWHLQVVHRNRSDNGVFIHQKARRHLVMKINSVFRPSSDVRREKLFRNDQRTAWFGITRDEGASPAFHDYGRYASLIEMTSNLTEQRGPWLPNDAQRACQRLRRFPSLVSFVGQTWAGKSSIIKLLIDLHCIGPHDFQTPVVGIPGSDAPTSDDVHLYLDPSTYDSNHPLLFADCEGLDGGEREPIAARFKKSKARMRKAYIDAYHRHRYAARRELTWSHEANKRSREFAVTNLYPRLLYTFSDVIVFILRVHSTIEKVLEKLVEWAAAALETSSNQPILPHAIIVLNATDPSAIDDSLWDVEISTRDLLDKLAGSVRTNMVFEQHAGSWKARNRRIKSPEDLLLAYYKSIKIVRMPTGERPNLVASQVKVLKESITSASDTARSDKEQLRMLLDADQLDPYLQCAFDHFSSTLEKPFDFVQASYTDSPIPHDFSGRILKLAIDMMNLRPKIPAGELFVDLSSMVASCIMLETARSQIPGTAEQIFPIYLQHLDTALQMFTELHWPCEFVKPGTASRCVNVRSGHGSKGHQFANGRIHVGDYVSKFKYQQYREVFEANVYFKYKRLLELLRGQVPLGDTEVRIAADIHQRETLTEFCWRASDRQPGRLLNHTVCYTCLLEPPEHVLPCGHVICTPCALSYGDNLRGTIVVSRCPMENQPIVPKWRFVPKPDAAGVRLLTLDGGGIRGIVELCILQQIEDELDNKLPIQLLFDMIIGTSTGGLIALGIGVQGWSIAEAQDQFLSLCDQAFTRRTGSHLRGIGRLVDSHHHSKYRTRPFEEALAQAFTKEQPLFGVDNANKHSNSRPNLKVGVISTRLPGSSVVLANYNRDCSESLSYQFIRAEKPSSELKLWEAARATSAAPGTFKPLYHQTTQKNYVDGGLYHNNPINIAWKEQQLAWPSSENAKPDIVVSIGTGSKPSTTSETVSPKTPRTPRTGILSHFTSTLQIVQSHIETSLDSERTWYSFLAVRSSEEKRRFFRLNPALTHDPPKLDETKEIYQLQREARRLMRGDDNVRQVALRLLAALFYFDVVESKDQEEIPLVKGRVRCRLPPGSYEFRALSLVVRNKSSETGAYFLIKEQGDEHAVRAPLASTELKSMHRLLDYQSAVVTIPLSSHSASIEALLCFDHKDGFMLSNLPRKALQAEASWKAGRAANTPANTRNSRPSFQDIQEARTHWRPPNSENVKWWSSASPESSRSISLPSGTALPPGGDHYAAKVELDSAQLNTRPELEDGANMCVPPRYDEVLEYGKAELNAPDRAELNTSDRAELNAPDRAELDDTRVVELQRSSTNSSDSKTSLVDRASELE